MEELKQKRKKVKYAMLITFILIIIFSKLARSAEIFLSINGLCGLAFIIELAYYISLFPHFWAKVLLIKTKTKEVEKEHCTNCGELISKYAEICYKCGVAPKKIENPKFCKYCGTSIKDEQVICLQCRNKVKRGQGAGWGEIFVSFLIPLIGFIIYANNISTKKQYAKDCLHCSLFGIFIYVLLLLLYLPNLYM